MRVLYLSTYNVKCGIATYTHELRSHLSVDNHVFPLPEKDDVIVNQVDLDKELKKFTQLVKDYDVVHIQHEHGLFIGAGDETDAVSRFGTLLKVLVKENKRVFVTFHSDPVFWESRWRFDTDILLKKLLSRVWEGEVSKWFQPRYDVTAVVHTKRTKQEFLDSGFHKDSVEVVPHGVVSREVKFTPVKPDLEINLSIFGFISDYKGYGVALQALQLLPRNYNLVCMGGRHPSSTGDEYTQILKTAKELDHTVVENRLQDIYNLVYDRVSITGYLDKAQADKIHKKTHICLAPYTDKTLSGSGALTWSLTSGCPVIASDIPSFKTIDDEYQCMHLFKTDAFHELAWSVKRVVGDVKYQRALVDGATSYAEQLSWSNVAEAHENLYK